jgi:hypothetical protein
MSRGETSWTPGGSGSMTKVLCVAVWVYYGCGMPNISASQDSSPLSQLCLRAVLRFGVSGMNNRQHRLTHSHLTLLIQSSGHFDSAPYGRSTRRSQKALWCLFLLVMRQRRTSFGRSPHPDQSGRLRLTRSRCFHADPLKLLGRIASAAHLLGAGTANVFSREHTIS